VEQIVPIVVALLAGGGLVGLLNYRASRRRTEADAKAVEATAEVTLGGGWQQMWESSRKEVNELRERVAILEDKEHRCLERLAMLEDKHASRTDVEKIVASLLDKEIVKREEHVHHGVHVHAPDPEPT
jgi:hypothetical protein